MHSPHEVRSFGAVRHAIPTAPGERQDAARAPVTARPAHYLFYQVYAGARLYSSINSAIRSPIAIDVQLVLARTQSGMMDASATRSRSTPYTRPS